MAERSWWALNQAELLGLGFLYSPCYVYHLPTVSDYAHKLLSLKAVSRIFYAVKANPHPRIIQQLAKLGLSFECVSLAELQWIKQICPDITADKLLFTPNFAPKNEYQQALALGCYLTIDSLYPLIHWPELFYAQTLMLRFDPNIQAGHHPYVRTAGITSKFGIDLKDIDRLLHIIKQAKIQVIGLHAHLGSGLLDASLWYQTAQLLISLANNFPDIHILNLGGGLGVGIDDRSDVDLYRLNQLLESLNTSYELWLEPGRFLVAESGVLLAKITQIKRKQEQFFIGIETGMNSLLRPSLYQANHPIVNLTHLDKPLSITADIVGPICESGDVLGSNRALPKCYEQDIILLAQTGAYGHCMSSYYNLRPPAVELILE